MLGMIGEHSLFCDLHFPLSVFLDRTWACKVLQAGNMANTTDEALIYVHLSAIQTHLCSEELVKVVFY